MTRFPVPILALALFAPTAASAPKVKDKAPPSPPIVGEWVRVGHTQAGTPVAPDRQPHHQAFKADGTWEYSYGGAPSPGGMSYATDPKQDPPTIDIRQAPGGPPNWRGVYQVEGETLTLCLVTGDTARPKKLESSADQRTTLWVFQRVRPKD